MRRSDLALGKGAEVLWVVPGLVAEGRRVGRALRERAALPEAVVVGVAPEEAEGLLHFLGEPEETEPWTEPYAIHLSRHGAVGFPPPAYLEAARYAREGGVRLVGADLTQDAYDALFTKRVSTLQWWRYGRRMRKLEKSPPRADSAEAFALAWDAHLRRTGRGIRAVEDAREEAVAASVRAAGAEGPVVAVLDLAQRPGVLGRLGAHP